MNQKTKLGIIFALVTACISGISIFYNKLVIVKGADPLIFNIFKNGGVACILSAILLFSAKRSSLLKLSVSSWKKLILIGIVGGSIPFVLYFEGLGSVSAANANLIHKTLFIWVAVMAVPFLGEKLSLWQVVGYLLVAWSNLFIGGLGRFTFGQGELMILAATLLWSVENVIAKISLSRIDSTLVAWGRMFIGSLILLAIAIFSGKIKLLTSINPENLAAIAGSILLLTGYVICWYKALSYAPATVVTSVLILATPITNILTSIFLTHTLPEISLLSIAVSSFGVFFISIFIPTLTKKNAVKIS